MKTLIKFSSFAMIIILIILFYFIHEKLPLVILVVFGWFKILILTDNLVDKFYKEKNKENFFSIEYYPKTGRYYPKYKKYYLNTYHITGIIEIKEDYLFTYCDYGKTEEEAKKIIELFKEQRLKENVKIIKY